MGYSDYGLDEKKLAQDPDSKVREWSCLWCNETVKNGFNLCFSNWVICRDCVETAHESDRWTDGVECWKCSAKNIRGMGCDPIWGEGEYYVCQPCIDWAKETFSKQDDFNNKTREQMTTEEILQQCRVSGHLIYLPDVQLDYTSEYKPVKKKLELIGGKWKGGKTNAFVFDHDPTDQMEVLRSGGQINLKKEFQFFPTPDALADRMVDMAFRAYFKNYSGMPAILEPSAGDGAIIKAISRKSPTLTVHCFELMEINRIRLEKIHTAQIIGDDFLQAVDSGITTKYDLIVANPPFAKNQDIDHIRAMYKCLKPGGVIVTIASRSWKTGSQKKQEQFSEWLDEMKADQVEINEGEFKESGTMVGAMLLRIEKPMINKSETGDHLIISENAQAVNTETEPSVEYTPSEADLLLQQKLYQADQEAISETDTQTDEKCNENEQDCAEGEQQYRQPNEILKDIESNVSNSLTIIQSLKQSLNPETEMNFFTQLAALLGQAEISLTVKAKDENLTVMIIPKGATQLENVKPLILSGNALDLDQEFFSTVSGSIQKISGIVSNAAEYEKSLNAAIVKTAASEDAKPTKSRSKTKSKDEAKEDVSNEPTTEVSAGTETITEAVTIDPVVETSAEPEVSQEELDRIAAEEAAATEAKKAEERKAQYGELIGKASSLIAANNFALALEAFEAAKEYADDVEALEGSIQSCKEAIERQEKVNMLISKSKEFATACDWKNAAGALKQARTLSDEPESHDNQIKEYMQKALEAEMAAEAPSYL